MPIMIILDFSLFIMPMMITKVACNFFSLIFHRVWDTQLVITMNLCLNYEVLKFFISTCKNISLVTVVYYLKLASCLDFNFFIWVGVASIEGNIEFVVLLDMANLEGWICNRCLSFVSSNYYILESIISKMMLTKQKLKKKPLGP